jgi:hypothetical protein
LPGVVESRFHGPIIWGTRVERRDIFRSRCNPVNRNILQGEEKFVRGSVALIG